MNNVSTKTNENVDEYINIDKVLILDNNEVHIDFSPVNDVVVSKNFARKSKKGA